MNSQNRDQLAWVVKQWPKVEDSGMDSLESTLPYKNCKEEAAACLRHRPRMVVD